MSIENLLVETGGFGKCQILLLFCLYFNKFMTGWSMLQMSFAGLIPDWFCLGVNDTSPSQNRTLKTCTVNNSTMIDRSISCDRYEFTGSIVTVISEWDLVCDLKWVKAAVTSIQMGGVLVGALVAGQMGDYIGRKKTLYFFVLQHGIVNLIAAFSVSWQMFAVCRFFIGLGIGGILVVVFPYSMEFLPVKWRAICSVLPAWALGICVCALAAYALENWSHVHIACGVASLLGGLGYFYVPESLRWLTVQEKLEEAEEVICKISKMNNKPVPANTKTILREVADEEKRARESGEKYTYVDVFRGWRTAKITLIFCFQWFVMSCVYYGISFGVSSLAGNVYLNIFLLAIVELPSLFCTFYLNNTIGRKWTAFITQAIACLAACICLILRLYDPIDSKGETITGLSLVAKMGIGAGWAVLQTWGTELYPTVTRNLGYGAANTASRVGGIIAPFLVDFDNMAVVSYIVIGCLLLADCVLTLLVPETKGTELQDSLTTFIKEDSNGLASEPHKLNGNK